MCHQAENESGTRQGASRFDGKHWTTYVAADGMSDNVVRSIAVAANGTLWFGTRSGVARYSASDVAAWSD